MSLARPQVDARSHVRGLDPLTASGFTLAGVGVAVSGTVIEMLQCAGMSPADAIDATVVVLAALLLPAGVVVLLIARAFNPGTGP